MSCLDAVRKMIPDRTMIFVLPGTGVVEYSQDRMAKKKAAIVMSAITTGGKARGLEQELQQLGCNGLLALWCWVGVIVGPEQGTQGRSHVGTSQEVKGAVLDMVPERRSQIACGSVHSTCDHWRATTPGKLTMCVPGGMPVQTQEGSEDEFTLIVE
jgi:hypothetical protein